VDCPNWGAGNPDEYRFCEQSGDALGLQGHGPDGQSGLPTTESWCSSCRHTDLIEFSFCERCGEGLADREGAAVAGDEPVALVPELLGGADRRYRACGGGGSD